MNKLVSVIVPVYNTEKYIRKCIESILKQTYTNIELILVNDGSEQLEADIIKEYLQTDQRVRYIENKTNLGLFRTRIVGVKQAKGKYIMFVDSDDYINIDFVRLLVQQSEKNQSDITFATTVLNTPKGKKVINILQDTALYKLPLDGEEIKRMYFEQEGRAYIWHTIWNKLYTKALWDRCLPYFEQLSSHVVMTEDIAFSSILFYFAKRVDRARNSVYYYCQHSDASTSTNNMTLDAYKKKVSDIGKVFAFLEDFYKDKEVYLKERLHGFKEYYARLWKGGILNVCEKDRKEAEQTFNSIFPGVVVKTTIEDSYFNLAQVPYSSQLDCIKEQILQSSCKYISFDVFDTLITRPFYNPTDLFYCLDKVYEDKVHTNTSFYTIRLEGEQGCRELLCKAGKKEDVVIREIYDYIGKIYGIPAQICEEIMRKECELEVQFSQRRNSAYELYEIARLAGKKIIITSDMYLDESTMIKILHKNGYEEFERIFVSSEYGKLKGTGSLYDEVLRELDINPTELMHIGDNQVSDIEAANSKGICTIYFPKAMDVFFDKIEGINTNSCATIGKKVAGSFKGQKAFEQLSGYGCMIAIVANDYFDNPYRPFHPLTDFNMDPYFIGYYALGMNLIAQIQWIEKLQKKYGFGKIIFTARDGYLIKKAYDFYIDIFGKKTVTKYMFASRRAMLPMILQSRSDFMNLPIVYQKYSPSMIKELLSFCTLELDELKWRDLCETNGIQPQKRFETILEYHKFMEFYLEYAYDPEKHKESMEVIKKYWNTVESDDFIYDMGYSASIHNAIVQATGKTPKALFIHTDKNKHNFLSRRGNFLIESLMDSIPNISGLLREHFFSDLCGTCQRYDIVKEKCVPILEEEEKMYVDFFPLQTIQCAALDFVKKFYGIFLDYVEYLDIRISDVEMPFEGFICSPSRLDTKIFSASYFEDKVYGALEKINIRNFWLQLLMGMSDNASMSAVSNLQNIVKDNGKSQIAIFGTGKMCKDLLDHYPIPVTVFLDNNVSKSGQDWYGGKIYLPSEVANISGYYIVIVCAAYIEIEEQLEEMGLVKYRDFTSYMELF